MITKAAFQQIDIEIQKGLKEVFDFIKNNCPDHDYILFLADGEYNQEYDKPSIRFNPFTIDNRSDRYKDESRRNFFLQFMRAFYSFENPTTEDNEYRITMELMIYTHIWESKPILKQLFRLASLSNGETYHWSVEVPEMGKHDFIRHEIRDVLDSKGLNLAKAITQGFHTSLRNAFAHSEYQIDMRSKFIHLDTFKGGDWDIKSISFDDWTKRFVYSSLLSYHFINERAARRSSLINDFGRDDFLIVHPITTRRFRINTIYYDPGFDRFSFYKIRK